MASYFASDVGEFLRTSTSEIHARLTLGHAREFHESKSDATLTWWDDVHNLQEALTAAVNKEPTISFWGVVLEFTVPRKGRRIDVVLLAGKRILLLECKSGVPGGEARRQAETYALLLHYFHSGSCEREIIPVAISPHDVPSEMRQSERLRFGQREMLFPSLPSYWIRSAQTLSWSELPDFLSTLTKDEEAQIDTAAWDDGAFRPTPTIIEAACALRGGLQLRDIARSEASEHEISEVTEEIQDVIRCAEQEKHHAICLLTGVPGSGKTLVGLSLAHLSDARSDAIHFMSGNGPLVSVLQELFRREAMRDGMRSQDALIRAKVLIENVHVFATTYTESDKDRPPSNHVIIFDEAQRAWNHAQNKAKFGRGYSEPEMLLKIMERHEDWACVVALVGGGQEINSGEAGLEEWGKALRGAKRDWTIYASPEVTEGGTSTAGRRLFGLNEQSDGVGTSREVAEMDVRESSYLHLRTSNRSLRADNLARWVNLVIGGHADEAARLEITSRFPIFLTRDLQAMRVKLRSECLGDSRYGLVGSSKASRLRAEGLEPDSSFHGGYPWHHWYLSSREDIRSSYAAEVFATEFEIQGLELDWVGMCWGGDLARSVDGWVERKLSYAVPPRWSLIKRADEQMYRRNAYRVLLTRARQGMVIFVPRGSDDDLTRAVTEMEGVAEFLLACGVKPLCGPA
jgi:hypothetical protein